MIRLAVFRAANPDVVIGDLGFRVWQARIPVPHGEVVVSAHVLEDLLDKLDELGRAGELPAV
jgi:hypothetical protein